MNSVSTSTPLGTGTQLYFQLEIMDSKIQTRITEIWLQGKSFTAN